jgi:hypothetical protein
LSSGSHERCRRKGVRELDTLRVRLDDQPECRISNGMALYARHEGVTRDANDADSRGRRGDVHLVLTISGLSLFWRPLNRNSYGN